MAVVQYDSKENAGHRFWTARYGRYAVRIDANRPAFTGGSSPWRAARSATASLPTVMRQPLR